MKHPRHWLVVLSAVAALSMASRPNLQSAQEGPEMLAIRIAPEQDEYLEDESIALSLEIENEGQEPVQVFEPAFGSNPQPVYEITGPSFPDTKRFNKLSSAGERELAEPAVVTIPPGGTWRGSELVSQLVGPLQPGEYRLAATYSWQGKTAKSEERRIRVKATEFSSIHAAQGLRALGRGEGRVVFLSPSAGSASLAAFAFHETRPDKGEIEANPPIVQFKAGPQATEVGSAWSNSPIFKELVQWTVWREGRTIKAVSDASTEALFLNLPAEPSFLVRPPLKVKDKPVEVLAVGSDQQLSLSSFPVNFDPKATPKLVWQPRLPAKPVAAVAALGPQGNDSRHIAFVASTGQSVEVFHSSYREGGPLAPFQSIRVPDVQLVPNISPAMMVDSGGSTRVTVIVSSRDGKSYSAVESQFRNSGAPADGPNILSLGSLDQPVTGGAVLYAERAGTLQRRDIAVLTANPGTGPVLRRWLTASGGWKTFGPNLTPVEPVILVPGENYAYVLCFASGRGFYFEPL
jgi:hypothetical protein